MLMRVVKGCDGVDCYMLRTKEEKTEREKSDEGVSGRLALESWEADESGGGSMSLYVNHGGAGGGWDLCLRLLFSVPHYSGEQIWSVLEESTLEPVKREKWAHWDDKGS